MKPQLNLSKNARLPTIVLRLIDEGPQPMRGNRPGQKNPNAADQFWAQNEDEHERRAAKPTAVNVQEYNEVPMLRGAVAKKAATTKVPASAKVDKPITTDHKNRHDPNCAHCRRSKFKNSPRKPARRVSHSRNRKRELKSRITKTAYRHGKGRARVLRSGYNASGGTGNGKCRCRYCLRVTNKGTCTNLVLKEASTCTIMGVKKDGKRVSVDTDGSHTPVSADSDRSEIYTDSQKSIHSGSFNSNLSHMSLDHEPMVTSDS